MDDLIEFNQDLDNATQVFVSSGKSKGQQDLTRIVSTPTPARTAAQTPLVAPVQICASTKSKLKDRRRYTTVVALDGATERFMGDFQDLSSEAHVVVAVGQSNAHGLADSVAIQSPAGIAVQVPLPTPVPTPAPLWAWDGTTVEPPIPTPASTPAPI